MKNEFVYCESCGSWTDNAEEVHLMKNGELDPMCPFCGEVGKLILKNSKNI